MKINLKRLKETPPLNLGILPARQPIPTFAAANFLGIHEKTLLKWNRWGLCPSPVPRDKYLGAELYWIPAELIAWWEKMALDTPRSVKEICDQWFEENRLLWRCGFNPVSYPPKPLHKQQRRREMQTQAIRVR